VAGRIGVNRTTLAAELESMDEWILARRPVAASLHHERVSIWRRLPMAHDLIDLVELSLWLSQCPVARSTVVKGAPIVTDALLR